MTAQPLTIPQFKVASAKVRMPKRVRQVEMSPEEALDRLLDIASVQLIHDPGCSGDGKRVAPDEMGFCSCEPRILATVSIDSNWSSPVYDGLTVDALRQRVRQPATKQVVRLADGSVPQSYRSVAVGSDAESDLRSALVRGDVTRGELLTFIEDSLAAAKKVLR